MNRDRSPVRGRTRGIRGDDRERERGLRTVNGRPRKTQEELDKEMEDYWSGKKNEPNGEKESQATPAVVEDDDIEMIT